MIVQGSLNYTTSGRRKVSSKSRMKRRQQLHHWQTTKEHPEHMPEVDWKHKYRPIYPSVPLGDPNPDETAKQDKSYTSSSRHTIAPAYNKGAYQVITEETIKDIGR